MDLTLSREVRASPDHVWAVLTDFDRWSEIISGINRIERLDGGTGVGPGTRWRETRTVIGKSRTEEMEVTAVSPGRSYTVESDGAGAHYTSVFTVEPSGSGTRLTMTFGGRASGTFSRLMTATVGRLLIGTARKAMQRDLDDIAAFAESTAGPA